ncbi:MAG: nucleotidyltransferase substrate binding protein [Deltaproteobacteria bacterium]|nr:nucleotidyltransferase substrate binding protein [Deltaproteobacteria bacterium]
MLDLTRLRKAVGSLGRSIEAARTHMDSLSEDMKETVRAGVIQNFEVACEQSWKFIQRRIRENRTSDEAEHARSRRELFRLAARFGLLRDPVPWFEYGDARNLTSHTHNEAEALTAYRIAQRFLDDAKALLARLEQDD